MGAPLSGMTVKLRLACWAQTCAARRIWFSQVVVDHLALKVANRLLLTPPRLVPSGTKLMVTSWGFGQAFPEVVYGTTRDSRDSTDKRAFSCVGEALRWVRAERTAGCMGLPEGWIFRVQQAHGW